MLVDDEVVSIDGRPIPEIGMIKTMTVARVGTTSTVTIRRGGRDETFNGVAITKDTHARTPRTHARCASLSSEPASLHASLDPATLVQMH